MSNVLNIPRRTHLAFGFFRFDLYRRCRSYDNDEIGHTLLFFDNAVQFGVCRNIPARVVYEKRIAEYSEVLSR